MSDKFYFLKIDGKVEAFNYPYELNGANEVWKNILPSQFLSVEEIATHQLETLNPEFMLMLAIAKKPELISYHFSYGMWIRNTYGLWHPNNPFVIKDDLGDGHPDGLSMLVIESIHRQLQQE